MPPTPNRPRCRRCIILGKLEAAAQLIELAYVEAQAIKDEEGSYAPLSCLQTLVSNTNSSVTTALEAVYDTM